MNVRRTVAITALALVGCARPLPQAGEPAAQLYVQRCGGCHRPYDPSSLTAEMWAIQLDAMQTKIAEAGEPALSAGDRQALLEYLKHNAGKQ